MVRGWTPGMTPKNYSLPRKKMFRHNIGIRQFGLYFSLFYCCLSVRLFAHIFDFDQRIHQELFLNSVYISFSFRIWCRPLDSEKKFLSNGMHIMHIRYKINVLSILTPIITVIPLLRPWNCLKQPTFDVFRLNEQFSITTSHQICRKSPDT